MLNLNGSHNFKMCVDDSRNDDDENDDDHEHDDDEDNHDDHDYNDGEEADDDDVDLSPSHHSRLVLMMAMMIEVMIMITLMINHRPTQIVISLYGAAVRAGRTFRG